MILDLDPEAGMYVWCIANFVTDKQTDKAMLGVGLYSIMDVCSREIIF
jgi:hypothetical protein